MKVIEEVWKTLGDVLGSIWYFITNVFFYAKKLLDFALKNFIPIMLVAGMVGALYFLYKIFGTMNSAGGSDE